MQEASETPILNERGIIITGKHADQKRLKRYNKMLNNKYDIRAELEDAEADRVKLEYKKRSQIQLSALFLKANKWKVELHGEHKDYYDDILLKKRDWNTTFLYAYSNDLDQDHHSTDSEYLVGIGCITAQRRCLPFMMVPKSDCRMKAAVASGSSSLTRESGCHSISPES